MEKKVNPIATMLLLTMACLLMNVLWHWKVALYLTFVFGGVGMLSPVLSRQVSRAWMWVAGLLGRVTNGVLLSVVYLLVVVPVGTVRRLLGKDTMTRFEGAARTNFTSRDHLFRKEDLERTW